MSKQTSLTILAPPPAEHLLREREPEPSTKTLMVVLVPARFVDLLIERFPLNKRRGDYLFKVVGMHSFTSVQFYVNHWHADAAQLIALQAFAEMLNLAGVGSVYRLMISAVEPWRNKEYS